MANLILFALLLAWLFVCMIYDQRFREVPAKLTIFPLIIAGLYALWRGWWVPPLLAAGLILISDP